MQPEFGGRRYEVRGGLQVLARHEVLARRALEAEARRPSPALKASHRFDAPLRAAAHSLFQSSAVMPAVL
jgi:hypothetical protein